MKEKDLRFKKIVEGLKSLLVLSLVSSAVSILPILPIVKYLGLRISTTLSQPIEDNKSLEVLETKNSLEKRKLNFDDFSFSKIQEKKVLTLEHDDSIDIPESKNPLGYSSSRLPNENISDRARRITFRYGFLEFYLPISDLESYADKGEISNELNFFLRRIDPQEQWLRDLLNYSFNLEDDQRSNLIAFDQLLTSEEGGLILSKLDELIQTGSQIDNNHLAIRGAVLLAASYSENVTLIEIIRHFPTEEIVLEIRELSQLVEGFESLNLHGLISGDLCTPNSSEGRIEQTIEQADKLLQEAFFCLLTEDYFLVEEKLENSLHIRQEISDYLGEGITLLSLGLLYNMGGYFAPATDHTSKALDIFNQADFNAGKALALGNLGWSYFAEGEYYKAIKYYEQSIKIYEETEEIEREEFTDHDFIDLALKNVLIDFSPANIVKSIHKYLGEAIILGHIGAVYQALNQDDLALENFQRALVIHQETGFLSQEAVNLHRIGRIHQNNGEYDLALDNFKAAQGIQETLNNRLDQDASIVFDRPYSRLIYPIAGSGSVQLSIAWNYFLSNQYDEVLNYSENILDFYREERKNRNTYSPSEINNLYLLGHTYHRMGDYETALEYYNLALEITHKLEEEYGKEYKTIRAEIYSEIAFTYEILNAISEEILDENDLTSPKSKMKLAISFYKKAINTFEQIRLANNELPLDLQISLVDSFAENYRNLADLLISEGRVLEALQVLELLKAEEIREYTRGTVTNLQEGKIELSPAETNIIDKHDSLVELGLKIYDCENGLQTCSEDDLFDWYEDRTTLTAEWNTLISKLELTIDPIAPNPRDLITEGVAEVLETQPNTILIYPVVLKDRLVLLWATRGGVTNAIELPQVTEADINKAAFEFRRLMHQCETSGCTTDDIPAIQAVAQQFHQWLIPKDLDDLLQQEGIENLVFALDQQLRYIPIAALHNGDQYLVERYTLSTVTAAWLTPTANPLPTNPADVSVLALGLSDEVPDNDPTDDVPYFSPLEHVPTELDGIVRSLDASDSTGIYPGTNLLNKDFDDRAFYRLKIDGHQILHIATHGLFVPTNLYSSFLMLGTREDWRISEMQNVGQQFTDLSLVVLSACETALGGNQQSASEAGELDGREISGIAQTFLDAGADAIIASLWKVSDSSTSALMQQFYLELAKGTETNPVTFSEALQSAQLSLLTGNIDPAVAATLNRGPVSWGDPPTTTEGNASETLPDLSHPFYWAPFTLIGNGL